MLGVSETEPPHHVPVEVSHLDDSTAIDDSTTIDEQDVPPELADAIQTAFGLDEPPATLGDWVSATTRLLDDAGLSVGVEDMCTTDESRHVARVDGDDRQFHCVLDTLLVPFLLPEASPVAVRSRSPVSGDVVELSVSRDEVEVTPTGAVMSFGFADDLDVPDPGDLDPALAYEAICPYVNAFPSRSEYDAWARETPGASTMALSFPAGLDLAGTLAERPAYGAD